MTGPVDFPPVLVQAAGLFRHSGDKLEAQVAESAPGTIDSSCSRTGPVEFTDARRDLDGGGSARAGRGDQAVAVKCVAAAVKDRRLRRLGRAERVNRWGLKFTLLADMLGRIGVVFGAARLASMLRWGACDS